MNKEEEILKNFVTSHQNSADNSECLIDTDDTENKPKAKNKYVHTEYNPANPDIMEFNYIQECIDARSCISEDEENDLSRVIVEDVDNKKLDREMMEQVEVMTDEEKEKDSMDTYSKIEALKEDISVLEKQLDSVEKALPIIALIRKEVSSEKAKEFEMKCLKALEDGQNLDCILENFNDINSTLQGEMKGEAEMDEENQHHLPQIFLTKEPEKDHSLSPGEMTPVETLLVKKPEVRKGKKTVISQNEKKHFDKFFSDEDEENLDEQPVDKTSTDLKSQRKRKYKPHMKRSKYERHDIDKWNSRKSYISASKIREFGMKKTKDSGSDGEYFPDEDLSDDWEDVQIKKSEAEMDEENQHHLQQIFFSVEPEKDHSLSLGEMTPVETLLVKKPEIRKGKKTVISQNEKKHFDKFFSEEDEENLDEQPVDKTSTDLKSQRKRNYKPNMKRSKYARYDKDKRNFRRSYISASKIREFGMKKTKDSGSDGEYFPDEDLSDDWEDVQIKKSEAEMNEENQHHLQQIFLSVEPEKDHSLSLGEITPVETLLVKKPEVRKGKKTVISQIEKKHFDKFFSEEDEENLDEQPVDKTSSDLKSQRKRKYKSNMKRSKYARHDKDKRNSRRSYKSASKIREFGMNKYDLSDDWEDVGIKKRKKKKISSKSKNLCGLNAIKSNRKKMKVIDDGDKDAFIKRLRAYEKAELVKKQRAIESGERDNEKDYVELKNHLRVPKSVWDKLYNYQQAGVEWLWELHQQDSGGILGDEMGLGKTIQVIVFLIALKYSRLSTYTMDESIGLGPVILVCPGTLLQQWVKHFHSWWPPFRVAVLHESGSFVGKKTTLVNDINKRGGILITTYNGIVQHQECLLEKDWHYVILDEGHKIRNPDAQATLIVKQFRTSHRLILSGSPIQNNLKELWSLFDFILPGKLGTLPVFMQEFNEPIIQGGYVKASQIQVQTAHKCATVLQNSIKPYLLRRVKSDVKNIINLPSKSEQVLFCQLTEQQVELYKKYLDSKDVDKILNGTLQLFVGVSNLRNLCNHPDLFTGRPEICKDTDTLSEEDYYGNYKRSGKMIVVEKLLNLWHKQGHRVLLFTQTRKMLEILEILVKNKGYTFMKMDGSTSIQSRQPLITQFNSDKNIFVFLLTTRVGGLGVNLTGADRIIIYDPDWNPSNDSQAKERAWRIGQNNHVTIYRLLTAGTIEEKIYQRQIFKQLLSNRVLKDPRQRRFFNRSNYLELFTYKEGKDKGTETGALFAGTGSEVKLKKKYKHKQNADRSIEDRRDSVSHIQKEVAVTFSVDKIEKMKQLAKKISSELSKNCMNTKSNEANCEHEEQHEAKDKGSVESKMSEHRFKPSQKRKRSAQEIDGEKIDFVVKKAVYKSPKKDESHKSVKDDEYVLSKLFKSSGVHTVIKHDKIVESSTPDHVIVEAEAKKVALDAVKALKASRKMCARAEEGIPTWTGKNGKKPKFGPKNKNSLNCPSDQPGPSGIKNAPTSTEFLATILYRKYNASDVQSDDIDERHVKARHIFDPKSAEYDKILTELRNFVAVGGAVAGEATTKEIVDVFRPKVPNADAAIFKAMLTKICDIVRDNDRGCIWKLKEEFK